MSNAEATIIGQFLAEAVEREHAATRKVIAAIPEGKESFTPDPKSMTAIDLAWHIAGAEWMFARMVLDGKQPGGESARPEAVKTAADVLKFYDETVKPVKDQLKSAKPEQFGAIIDFYGVIQAPGYAFLNMMNVHSVHHRGQLSTYLRPMGVKVPAIYGMSADENPFEQASAAQQG